MSNSFVLVLFTAFSTNLKKYRIKIISPLLTMCSAFPPKYFFTHLSLLSFLSLSQCKKQTTSMSQCRITAHGTPFRFVDVGGQRSERRNWLYCFQVYDLFFAMKFVCFVVRGSFLLLLLSRVRQSICILEFIQQ